MVYIVFVTRTFVRTKLFDKQAEAAGLTEERVRKLEEHLLKMGCRDGTHITSNIWKTRWSLEGKGKSGGVRIYYFDYIEISHTFMLLTYPKSEKDNLSKAEISELAKFVKEIKNEYGI